MAPYVRFTAHAKWSRGGVLKNSVYLEGVQLRRTHRIHLLKSITSLVMISALALGSVVYQQSQPANALPPALLASDIDYYPNLTGVERFHAELNEPVIPETGNFTAEAWINPKPHSGDAFKAIFTQNQTGNTGTNRLYLGLKWIDRTTDPVVEARYVVFLLYHGASGSEVSHEIEIADGIQVNSWSHIALTVSGTTSTVYFNGRTVAAISNFSPVAKTDRAPFTIGAANPGGGNDFFGGIDQVKVYDGALSESEIATSMHTWGAISGKTLRAHYDFNDRTASGSKVFDKSDTTSSGYHLDATGTATFLDVKSIEEVTGRQIITFPRSYLTATGGWRVPAGVTSFDSLVVGAGGGGGSDGGGGGGGGAVNQAVNQSATAGAYLGIIVGQGGLGGSHKRVQSATGGQDSAIASGASAILSASGGAGGHGWRNGGSASQAAGGSGGVGGVITAGALGGLGAQACIADASTAPSYGSPANGAEGKQAALTGLIYGSGGGGGIAVKDAQTVVQVSQSNTAGDGAGKGSIVEATGDASPGFSALANRGGGGGGSAACGRMTSVAPIVPLYGYSRADGGNGGSGVVVISIALVAKCVYSSGGWTVTQKPRIDLLPLGTFGPTRTIIAENVVTPFYGEVAVVKGKIYAADRGRNLLRRLDINGQNLESVGSLPSPGLGVATDGRYVYAIGSTGIARYDTETGVYQQTYIGKGDIAHVHGEIAFARFNGIGYLFIGNNADNSTGERFSRVHAVPVSGTTIPTQISNVTHLFSQSKLAGEADSTIGASGVAVLGNNVYWAEFNPQAEGRVFRKAVTFDADGATTNLPTATVAAPSNQTVADEVVTSGVFIRNVSADGNFVYFQRNNTWNRLDPANSHARTTVLSSGAFFSANGMVPSANCVQSPRDISAAVLENGTVTVNFSSAYPAPTTGVFYRVEYRVNGGAWVEGLGASTTHSGSFSPAQALSGDVEVRVATLAYGVYSEFSYAPILSSTPPTPPPLCASPMRLEYDVPANTTVTLPFSNGPVSTTVTVRWAQGVDSAPITWTNGSRVVSHTFATAGDYQVQVCGQFTGFGSASVLHPYLTKVISWGEAASSLTSLAFAFRGALILTDVPNTLPSGVTNLQGTFINAKILNDADVAGWNVSNVTNLSETFNGASAFNQNLGSWNVTNVSTMAFTFANATAFNNGGSDEIKNWATSNVTNFVGTFTSARAFNQPIGSWNTSSATSTRSMFEGAIAFNQPLANWTTTSVTSMRGMFSFAQSFNQNIGSWNTSAVTDFSSMFSQAIAFNNGGSDTIKNWNTAAATNMAYMFFQTSVFNQPLTTDVNKWNVANVTDMQYMFGKARVFNQDLSTWNVSNVTNMNSMFWLASAFNNGSAAGTTLNWNTLKVTNMNQMFFYASNFKRVLDFEIDALNTAVDMLSFSGLSDDQYGLTISDFENQFTAGGAQTGVSLGATDKTALCNTPQQDLLTLVAATSASGAGWTITDKTIRTAGHCTPQVTITAKSGSHVYGSPLPAIGYDIAVTNGSLPTSDWLNDVTCRAVFVSGGASVTTTSAAAVVSTKSGDTVSGTYKTACFGPTGTGLGINVTYKDNVYEIAKRPITVRAVDRAVFAGQALLSTSASSSDVTPQVLVTSGSILAGDIVNYTLTFTSATNGASDNGTVYAGDGTYSITPSLSSGDATANYQITAVAGTLSVTTKTYIISARSQTKLYGDLKTFGTDDWTCVVKVSGTPATSEPCSGSIGVALTSAGTASSALVNSFAITVGDVSGLPDGAVVEKINGNLIVKKRPIVVTANSKQVAYGSAAPNYDFTLMSSEFRNGNGANTITGITCGSEYVATGNGKTPRGTVLPITCTGGTSDFYELVYVAANLTVLEDSQVTSDVPQEIRLGEEETSTTASFAFNLTPVNQICFANLVVNFADGSSTVERMEVQPGSPLNFALPLEIGEYDYSLAVDGNCSIPETSGSLRILEYVAPEPEPEPEPEPQQNPSSNPVLLPSINSLSERQLPANQPAAVSIRGERLNMVTEITVGGVRVDFTINLDGSIRLSLPALRAGTYDMVVFHSYGSLTYPGAFTIGGSSTPISGGQTIPSENMKTRTLRFTNFAGDGFRLPSSARTGITRTFTAIGDVNRVVCRGLTSGRVASASDQRLATNRAREACNLARQLAPTASIELRTSPAAGIGPRFRAVNLFIVYSLD